jgi:hypothetical protein
VDERADVLRAEPAGVLRRLNEAKSLEAETEAEGVKMIRRSTAAGVRQTLRHPGLTILSWLWTLALAAVLALPVFGLFSSALGRTRAAGDALGAFNLRVLWQIFHYDRTSVGALAALAMAGLIFAAAVAGAFVAGGIVHTLVSPERGPFLARFFAGAGRLFGRYVRLLVITILAGGAAETLAGIALRPASTRLAQSSWEWGPIVASGANALVLAALLGFFVLVLDYARIRLATTDERSALRNWYFALRYVLRRPLATFTLGMAAVCALAVVLGGSVLLQARMPAATWQWIVALAVVQQVTMVLRAGVRVAQVASEVELARCAPGLVPAAPATDVPVLPLPVTSTDEVGRA